MHASTCCGTERAGRDHKWLLLWLVQEGVRPGQRLLSISDPIRTNEDWEVGSNTSLSRVRDAIQFRRPATISFQLSLASVEDDAGWRLEDAQQCVCCCKLQVLPLHPSDLVGEE